MIRAEAARVPPRPRHPGCPAVKAPPHAGASERPGAPPGPEASPRVPTQHDTVFRTVFGYGTTANAVFRPRGEENTA